jgi:hypothetical protein
MSNNKKKYNNPRVNQIFDDLEDYLDFCRLYGYRFNEADLYNMQSYPFQQFNKKRNGKNFKDQAGVDLARMR